MKKSDIIVSPDTKRKERVPPGQYLTKKWPVLQAGDVIEVDASTWTLRIFGLVEKEKVLTLDDFAKLPRVRVFCDMHCVTTWSKLDNNFEGVSSSVIKDLVKIKPEAKFVMVHGHVNWSTNLSLADFFEEDVLFADKYEDLPLTAGHGAPVRLIVPRLYLWKSAKWVTGVEFMAHDKPGFWESRGYHMHGDPWKEERYSEPPDMMGGGI